MRWDIVLAPQAIEDLRRLSARRRANVRDALETHLRHELRKVSRSRIERLRGLSKPQYGLRVEEIRVFHDVRESRVEVLAIMPKSAAADSLEEQGVER